MKPPVRKFVYSLRAVSMAASLCPISGALDAQAQVSIASGQPPNGLVGAPYSFTFTATGPNCSDEPTFDWSATGLPSGGLSLDVAGNLTGTPTTASPLTFTVT